MSARARRRAAERARLDLLAAETYVSDPARHPNGLRRDAFLAGVKYERQRTRLVWRRRAPEWLHLLALLVVAVLAVAAIWAMLVVLAWAGDALSPLNVQLPTI